MLYLSKSDFKMASVCPTKLFYKKEGYPSTAVDNPYVEFLADGGYMVETIAKLMFPDGEEMPFETTSDGWAHTYGALMRDSAVLFEATLIWEQFLARVDILEKRGSSFRLIEVKAKSFDSSDMESGSPFRGTNRTILACWRPYLEDVTFQVYVLRSLFPGSPINAFLCLVDKAKTTTVDTVFKNFEFTPRTSDPRSIPEVRYTGDPSLLRNDPFVTLVSVDAEVEELLPGVIERAEEFVAGLKGERAQKVAPRIGRKCAKCEYRTGLAERDGFAECWGERNRSGPLILDLYGVHAYGSKGATADRMIEEGRTGLLEIDPAKFVGAFARRQRIQFESTRDQREHVDEALRALLNSKRFPFHFIDFETSQSAVPFHSGMRPYENVAFQWSCHSIGAAGGEAVHSEWINTEDAYPNFEFARSLRDRIGLTGTVFIWSPFEKTTLRQIRRQMDRYEEEDSDLMSWLDFMIGDGSPFCDMMALAKEHYFHPAMGGKLRIKDVLPAVWRQNADLRARPEYQKYVATSSGQILNPYSSLPSLPFSDEEGEDDSMEAVVEGTGAMRTYQEMMYGLRSGDSQFRDACRQLLLNYCELDTAAMVMIWRHWMGPS